MKVITNPRITYRHSCILVLLKEINSWKLTIQAMPHLSPLTISITHGFAPRSISTITTIINTMIRHWRIRRVWRRGCRHAMHVLHHRQWRRTRFTELGYTRTIAWPRNFLRTVVLHSLAVGILVVVAWVFWLGRGEREGNWCQGFIAGFWNGGFGRGREGGGGGGGGGGVDDCPQCGVVKVFIVDDERRRHIERNSQRGVWLLWPEKICALNATTACTDLARIEDLNSNFKLLNDTV